MKKIVIAIAVVALLGGGAAWWWQQESTESNQTLKLYGNVDVRQVSLAFETSGRLSTVKVEEGDLVKAGDTLAQLDTTTLELQRQEAQARLEVQSQTLQKLRNGARPQELAQARSRVMAAQAEARRAGDDWRRLSRLSNNTKGQAISAQDLDRAKSAWQIAEAQVAEAQEALRLLEAGTRAEDLAAAQAQLHVIESQIAQLDHQIALGTLKAPVDAVVRSRLLEPGDMATSVKPVFALALTTPKWVRVYVEEPDLGQIKPGMSAQVVTDTDPSHPIAARVGYISSVAEFTPKTVQTESLRTSLVYEVRVVVTDEVDRLRLGQPATVTFPGVMKAAQ